ncbi:tripartite tricarboxylate transporter TctB family protein [Helicobacter mustelae]|uniref:Putative tricarboxylate transport protein TctB n=1 Tax=Helicobacter mustelae (strain ATCC 43772 / CCUG 25715 / CIP 103759 / LMG 18044 / NCTC 12198 / R85-136P) TaxID=679897 RepID=D3UIL7_HELM1|nr:putative tricarboxylate transport protein TctB [Helicobacter mustelae 12198]SQH71842.1 tricarboxylate transport protein TctB [Helicobacter mustelae]
MTSIRIFSLFLFALCLFLLYQGFGIETKITYEPLGPRAFPIGALFLILLVLLLLFFFAQKTEVKWKQQSLIKIALFLLVFFLYCFLFEILGFVLSSILFLFLSALIFGARWGRALIFAVICASVSFVLFDAFMQISLPRGIFFENFFMKG